MFIYVDRCRRIEIAVATLTMGALFEVMFSASVDWGLGVVIFHL